MWVLYLDVFECVFVHMPVYMFAYIAVPVITVGFLSKVINGSESGGTSHLQVSWSVSGSAPNVTDYYILPLMYMDFDDDDGTLTASFSQKFGTNNNGLPVAAVQGFAMKENA